MWPDAAGPLGGDGGPGGPCDPIPRSKGTRARGVDWPGSRVSPTAMRDRSGTERIRTQSFPPPVAALGVGDSNHSDNALRAGPGRLL